MTASLTPCCPVCSQPPCMVVAGGSQAFCGNDDCTTLCWDMSRSLDDNLLDIGFVQLPEGGNA